MIEYKCPYCGQAEYKPHSRNSGPFLSWSAVQHHSNHCVDNTHEYIISITLGPLNKSSLINYLIDYHSKTEHLPTMREFTVKDGFPIAYNSIKTLFGSWNNFIEAAGFIGRLSGNIQNCRTKSQTDGVLYKSSFEAYFVDNYLFGKYKYEYEKPYGNGWFTDFYILEKDLYIEVDGGIRPERIQEKINKVPNLVVIDKSIIYNKELVESLITSSHAG